MAMRDWTPVNRAPVRTSRPAPVASGNLQNQRDGVVADLSAAEGQHGLPRRDMQARDLGQPRRQQAFLQDLR
jgi:hypothetical protein